MLSRQDRCHIILIYTLSFMLLMIACVATYEIVYKPLHSNLTILQQRFDAATVNAVEHTHTFSPGNYDLWLRALHLSQQQLRNKIDAIVANAHLRLNEMRFDETIWVSSFYEMPVYLKVSGSFANLMNFFVALANAHLIFSFEKLALTKRDSMIQATVYLRIRMIK